MSEPTASRLADWWGVALLGCLAALGFAVVRGPALIVPGVLVGAMVVRVVVLRSRGLEIDGNVIRISRWRSTIDVPGDRCHLRFVNVDDFGKVMSPVLEVHDERGRLDRKVTLSEIRFVDDPLFPSDDHFLATNRAAIDMYERVAQVVAQADRPRRWMRRDRR